MTALLIALLAAAQQPAAEPPAVKVPEGEALKQAIAKRDEEFFALFFQGCDPERLETMVTPDLEMYHDKAGFNVRSGKQFVADYAKWCQERQEPGKYQSRRELVRSSLHVDPVPGWGAIQDAEHVFYERRNAGPEGPAVPEKLVGRARLTQVWVLGADGSWKLSRIVSFAHRGPADTPAQPPK
jgi:hypothetical protein